MAKEFIPVNELLERTTLEQFIKHYNFDSQIHRKGNEERIRNPFVCEKCDGNHQAVSVNWGDAVFMGHCYHCSVRGRVTTLLFGMKYGRQPTGGKLKGNEFKDIAADIAHVAGHSRTNEHSRQVNTTQHQSSESPAPAVETAKPITRKNNLPLHRNPDERIARLIHLSDELVRDPVEMNGRARAYLAGRKFMTPETMKKWDVGFLPSNSKSMLRGRFVYALRNERSEKIGYVGRDLAFDEKLAKWEDSDRTTQRPIKAKFPPGFARGSFLYGAERARLKSDEATNQLRKTGLVVVEGMNDVIALDSFGILAVGLCSNRISEGQIEKLVRWSKSLADGKITLMLDNDKEGQAGTVDLLLKLGSQAHIRTLWKSESSSRKGVGCQPEQLTVTDIADMFATL